MQRRVPTGARWYIVFFSLAGMVGGALALRDILDMDDAGEGMRLAALGAFAGLGVVEIAVRSLNFLYRRTPRIWLRVGSPVTALLVGAVGFRVLANPLRTSIRSGVSVRDDFVVRVGNGRIRALESPGSKRHVSPAGLERVNRSYSLTCSLVEDVTGSPSSRPEQISKAPQHARPRSPDMPENAARGIAPLLTWPYSRVASVVPCADAQGDYTP